MFMLYGIRGQMFTGSLEDLWRVHALARPSRIRKLAARGDELDVETTHHLDKPHEIAINAYKSLIHKDIERGPLFHAYQVMSRDIITLNDEDDIAKAWLVLREHHIHQAPVLNAQQTLVGIVSERDLLTKINVEGNKVLDTMHRQVSDVMISPVVAAEPVTDIRRIATVMLEHDIDGVPIVNEAHALVGFVSRDDILHAVIADPPLSLWR